MDEKKPYIQLLDESFPGIKANILRCEALGFVWPSTPFLKEERGEILSHVGLMEYPMVIDGQEYKAAALHAICTKASHRRQGLASTLLCEVLDWAKEKYKLIVLFTEIPQFYERFFFRCVQEYRFHLRCSAHQGVQSLIPVTSPRDDALFRCSYQKRAPLSHRWWVKDNGFITPLNALFATYPAYWSLYYSPSIDGIFSYEIKGTTLHLYDVIASTIPSLEQILDHMPTAIEDIYFYFPPERFAPEAVPQAHVYDNGHLMVYGNWPINQPGMIAPLSRC